MSQFESSEITRLRAEVEQLRDSRTRHLEIETKLIAEVERLTRERDEAVVLAENMRSQNSKLAIENIRLVGECEILRHVCDVASGTQYTLEATNERLEFANLEIERLTQELATERHSVEVSDQTCTAEMVARKIAEAARIDAEQDNERLRAFRDKLLAENTRLLNSFIEAERKLQQRADELNVLQGSIAAYQTGELERKLAMAVEALKFYSIRTSYVARTGNDSPISRDGFGDRARTTLAELEKSDD